MSQLSNSFTLPGSEFDLGLLAPEHRGKGGIDLAEAIADYFKDSFKGLSGTADIEASAESVSIRWVKKSGAQDLLQQIVERLNAGSREECLPILELLAKDQPDNPLIFYNLGMVLSDLGRLDDAISALQRACEIDTSDVNIIVALGVAYARMNKHEVAIELLEAAIQKSPEHPWAARNLASIYARNGEFEKALPLMEQAVTAMPNDQQALFGMALCKEGLGDHKAADEFYKRVIEVNPQDEIADMAKEARAELASRSFKESGSSVGRPDAVMFCLAALEKFAAVDENQVRQITFEIAMLGRNGFELSDAAKKYQLKNMEGEFSGLHLLCYMFVGFKQIAPQEDIGFDLSKEYSMAKQLFIQKSK